MAYITNENCYILEGKIWSINSRKSGCRTDILRAILGEFSTALAIHRKVFVFRFDLHLQHYTRNNRLITDFNRRLARRIKNKYDCLYRYCWVREQGQAEAQHYHFVIFLNGSKVQYPILIQNWIQTIWEYNGHVYWAGYHNVNWSNHNEIDKASYHISYLAKPTGKGNRPKQTKDFGSSHHQKTNNK